MEKFELKTDLDTPYIKIIRFLGAVGLGFFIATIIFTLKFEETINWLSALTGIILSIFFAFFPGAAKKQSLTIDEDGIQTHHYKFHWGERKEISWENISPLEWIRAEYTSKIKSALLKKLLYLSTLKNN